MITRLDQCGFITHTRPTVIRCKHCHLTIDDHGSGWVHTEGEQVGKHTCAIEPYGYHAEPVGTPCSDHPANPCNGAHQHDVDRRLWYGGEDDAEACSP